MIEAFGTDGWSWLNEPTTWTADGRLTVTTDPDTDFWRITHYGFVRDTGHVLGKQVTGDFGLRVTFGGDYRDQYDQAGIMLRVDERCWLKTGIELVDRQQQLSVVVTREFSDWSVVPLADPAPRITVEAHRVGDTVTVRSGAMLRQAYFPPDVPVFAGVMGASPDGEGFPVTFDEALFSRP